MTIIDSQTQISLDTPVSVCKAAEVLSNDNAQVGIIKVTSEELESSSDECDLTYCKKGHGSRPACGGLKPGQATKSQSSSSSASKTDPRTAAVKSTQVQGRGVSTSSKDKAKKAK